VKNLKDKKHKATATVFKENLLGVINSGDMDKLSICLQRSGRMENIGAICEVLDEQELSPTAKGLIYRRIEKNRKNE
jgi:hypothetical protein